MIYRLKRSLTAGELSPLMYGRTDLDRYKHGCRELTNAYIKPQGPVMRRPGTQFLYDMSTLFNTNSGGEDIAAYRLVDFVFDETQAYCIIFLTGDGGTTLIYFAAYDATNDVWGLVASGGSPYYVTSGLTNFSAASFDYAQSKDVLFIAYGAGPPAQLARNTHTSWALSTITFTGSPSKWTTGDYPQHVSFYEQRLVFAATDSYPQHLWFSETGDFFNFTLGTSGSDPFEIQIKSERHNKIQWLASGAKLSVGTIGDEWVISGGSATFTIENVQTNRYSARGSEDIRPVVVGSSILYIERLGRVVNEFIYNYDSASYVSINLSILSPHLTDDYNIIRWSYQQVPNSIVWCTRSDGVMLALTFQREHQVIGWALHSTEGIFKDVCCTPNDDYRETDTWILVEREIDGTDYMYLERMHQEFLSQDVEEAWMVDSGLQYDNPGVPITTVTGLGHLEGKEVSILTNGAVHPRQTVASGSIELNFSSDKITIGLPYTSRIKPLSLELGLEEGTSIGRQQRITNIGVYLYRSLGMWIGKDEDEMEEVPFRLPTDLTGQGVPLFSGIRKVAFPEGYDNEAIIVIEQRQPLPMIVVAIVDESEVYN